MFSYLSRIVHLGMDAVMCSMMNTVQWRLKHHTVTSEHLEEYLSECEGHDYRSYYATPEENRSLQPPDWQVVGNHLYWNSPLQGAHHENNSVRARLFNSKEGDGSPTMILLHALMSANDFGYRRIAGRLNRRGWNVIFPHLPYHYSRTPSGYANGSLTVTTDLIRNAEALRQSVIELRQLMAWARNRGSTRLAILGTSYGAWVAALTLPLEVTDFTILLQPVTDVSDAVFRNPASRTMSDLLRNNNIHPSTISRHAFLSSPSGIKPLTPVERITVIGGKYDQLSPPESLRLLCDKWGGTRYLEVNQGHFGYSAMRCALTEADLYIDHPPPNPVSFT